MPPRSAATGLGRLGPVLAAVLLAACAPQRFLSIDSVPPGARVWLDEDEIGTTPLEIPFEHYGVRRVSLELPGYHTRSERIALVAPWYAVFPIDIVSEVLLPFGWSDRKSFHFTLDPGTDAITLPDLRSVLDRAEALRRAGPAGPRKLPPIRPAEESGGVPPPPPPGVQPPGDPPAIPPGGGGG